MDVHFGLDPFKGLKMRLSKILLHILEGAFPHRLIETGQGRHGPDGSVRDEFSDPFHWETQSQCETFYVMEPINNPRE